jgi:hypothetical protein
MVCDTCGERVTEDLAFLDHRSMMFSNEVVVQDRVGVRFSEKGVGSVGGGWHREAAISNNKFERIDHVQEKSSSVVGGRCSSRCECRSRGMSWVSISQPTGEGA